MLQVTRINDTLYKCNWCGCSYDIDDAYYKRGNTFFCSKECVLAYDKYILEEQNQVIS